MKDDILDVLRKSENPLTEIEIQDKLNVSLDKLCEELRTMEKCGDVYVTKKGKYTLYENTHLKVGRLSVSKKGFGFVLMEGEPDIHIKKENMNGAIHNDLVVCEYISEEEGKIIRILDRSLDTVIGEYAVNEEGKGYIIVDDSRIKMYIIIDENHRNGAMPGHKVIVKPYAQIHNNKYYGEVIKILGHKDDVGIDILSKVYEHDIEPNFSDETIEELKNIPDEVDVDDLVGRKDLRFEKIITMDGDDAKDFDDAISISKLDNGNYKLGVHIADVSHYVKMGSAIEKEAYSRGTSVYLANTVIPMLPHILSNGICSLNEDVDRLAMSCEMEIDPTGKIVDSDIFPSIIRSRKKMTYKNVNKILEDGVIPEGYEPFAKDLLEMGKLAKILRKEKVGRGYIEFDIDEAKIIVDEKGEAIDVVKRYRGAGENLIEDFMIAANETVASTIYFMDLPFVYRIHGEPNEEKIESFKKLLRVLGYKVEKTDKITPKVMQKILDDLKDKKEFYVLSNLLLRSMQKATYDPNNIGHFGLASKCYTHFTSPIRRYPDLTVHRLLKKYLIEHDMSPETITYLESILPELTSHASKQERLAVECERAVDDMKKAEYIKICKQIKELLYKSNMRGADYVDMLELEHLQRSAYIHELDIQGLQQLLCLKPYIKAIYRSNTNGRCLVFEFRC